MTETLAQKTEWLFLHVPNTESDQLHTAVSIAHRIHSMLPGVAVTEDSILAVRDGTDECPRRELVEGIARAFGVSPAFLTSNAVTTRDMQEQFELLAAVKGLLRRVREQGAREPLWLGCVR